MVLLTACSRGGDGVPVLDPDFIAVEDPNRFLQFLNAQVGLPAGTYTLVAGTENPGVSGDFTITVTRDDGSTRNFSGSWTSSDGQNAVAGGGNPDFSYTMPYSGGATFEISSSVDTCLYLLDPGGSVKIGQSGGDGCTNPRKIKVETPFSRINLEANAKAYYHAIDPPLDENGDIDFANGTSTRDTLDKWKKANGFGKKCDQYFIDRDELCETHVIFRDTKDLGYGRDMHARMEKNPDGSVKRFAVFVRNFRVNALPGMQYTTLNLDAAVSNNDDPTGYDNIQWHFGSNAIEFSSYPYGTGEPRADYAATLPGGVYATNSGEAPLYAKFFTFRPDDVTDPNTTERRLDMVDLDSHGFKSMPGPCISCHGGMGRAQLPVDNDGDGLFDFAPPIPGGIPGDTQSQMQVIEVSTITFSDAPKWTCEKIRKRLHFINQGVLSTYKTVQDQYGGVLGYWQPEFAAELIKGWYGDSNANAEDPSDFTIPNASCDHLQNHFYDYVPKDWRPDPNTGTPPPGADDLFREVIAPHCMVCHSRRGTNLGTNQSPGTRQDIDFSSYERFISHAEQIERFIFHKGVMPLGGLNFDAFWDNSGPGRAELLASHLPGFNSFDSKGKVQRPGKPFAVIAAPRNTNAPVILSAEGSSFADSYSWEIIDTASGSDPAELSGADTARPVLSVDAGGEGEYTIRLTARKGSDTDTATVTVAIDNSLPLPSSLRFDPDIKNVLQNNVGPNCDRCHSPQGTPGGGLVAGIPVFYVDNNDFPFGDPGYDPFRQPEGRDLYDNVLLRINFKEPVESLLLRKPSGNHHFGECREGFDLTDTPGDCNGTNGDRSNYDLFLNWILQGAPK
ncbi:MAG TPA: hypothetical protein VFX02_02075 [Gammaproteobacteria bacterium]|nr:hypothetical protein [Gammaproteobacteria bacterium]